MTTCFKRFEPVFVVATLVTLWCKQSFENLMCVNRMFLFSVERQDERISEMKREYHALHERHSEVSCKPGFIEDILYRKTAYCTASRKAFAWR